MLLLSVPHHQASSGKAFYAYCGCSCWAPGALDAEQLNLVSRLFRRQRSLCLQGSSSEAVPTAYCLLPTAYPFGLYPLGRARRMRSARQSSLTDSPRASLSTGVLQRGGECLLRGVSSGAGAGRLGTCRLGPPAAGHRAALRKEVSVCLGGVIVACTCLRDAPK